MDKQRIIDILKKHSYSFTNLKEILSVDETTLSMTLQEMLIDGEIVQQRKEFYLPSNLNLIRGQIISIKENYAFASIHDQDDAYIDNKYLKSAFLGDLVFLSRDRTSRRDDEYRVHSIISRSRNNIVGEVKIIQGEYLLITKNLTSKDITFVLEEYPSNIAEGSIVLCTVLKSYAKEILLKVIEVLGNKNDPGVDISKIILSHDAPINFPFEVKKAVKTIPNEVSEKDLKGREDFRDHIIVTIDGDDAKDFDDAIEVSKIGDNYEIGVHIADVSYYVKENQAIDLEAFNRGTSLYCSDQVVPMLPFELSNGICSLNPHVDRLVTSCIVLINPQGEVIKSKIVKGVINSKARLTYNYVNQFLEDQSNKSLFPKEINDLIFLSYQVSQIIRAKRTKLGCLALESTELKFVHDEKMQPIEILKKKQGKGELLIEDFMILANEVVASTLEKTKVPSLYRIHENPKSKKIESFIALSNHLGFHCNFSCLDVTPLDLSLHLKKMPIEKKEVLSSILLRCLAKARYATQNLGHFGLASVSYTHFTSPIRRYPDLVVHRLIKRYIIDKNVEFDSIFAEKLEYIAENTSIKERRALTIEREVEDLESAKYMKDKLGQSFDGKVVGISNKGLFVELLSGIQGFVSFESIPGDYYIYDEKYMSAFGRRTKKRFSLGDQVKVIVTEVDVAKYRIAFSLQLDKKKAIIKEKARKGAKYGHKNHRK